MFKAGISAQICLKVLLMKKRKKSPSAGGFALRYPMPPATGVTPSNPALALFRSESSLRAYSNYNQRFQVTVKKDGTK